MNNFISNPNKLIDEVWQDKDVLNNRCRLTLSKDSMLLVILNSIYLIFLLTLLARMKIESMFNLHFTEIIYEEETQ